MTRHGDNADLFAMKPPSLPPPSPRRNHTSEVVARLHAGFLFSLHAHCTVIERGKLLRRRVRGMVGVNMRTRFTISLSPTLLPCLSFSVPRTFSLSHSFSLPLAPSHSLCPPPHPSVPLFLSSLFHYLYLCPLSLTQSLCPTLTLCFSHPSTLLLSFSVSSFRISVCVCVSV